MIKHPTQNRPCLIAIPAHDEADRIGPCLDAIAASLHRPPPAIVLLVNNTTDETRLVARRTASAAGLVLHLLDVRLPSARATAGEARRLAMAHAARLAPDGAVLITTDADSRVEPGWLDANLRAIEAGADAVCGVAIIDPREAGAIPRHLHDDDEREMLYAALLDDVTALLDPDPADPWPRHSEESGASIAVRKAIFQRAGGVPPLASGEDRAFVQSLRRIDARIRHAPEARVIVSGRLQGRAFGGMADTMRRRMIEQDAWLDDRLEPVLDATHRAGCRAALRQTWSLGPRDLPFGALWERHEAADGILSRRRRVERSEVEPAIAQARAIVRTLALTARIRLENRVRSAGPSGTLPLAAVAAP